MKIKMLSIPLVLIASVVGASSPGFADDAVEPRNPSVAMFGDEVLELSVSWGQATACVELGDRTECFETEDDLLAAYPRFGSMPDPTRAPGLESSSLSLYCSSYLRLYRSTGYSGGTLYLSTRQQWLNLSIWGFDNDTSSYKVGGCSTVFRSGSNGSGSTYPGPTSAWAHAAAMGWGWSNVTSSVYIY